MDRLAERSARLEEKRRRSIAAYPRCLAQVFSEWGQADPADTVWLLYSANYLFRAGGVRWAIDPLTLTHRLGTYRLGTPDQPDLGYMSDRLDFVLLTHQHKDHFDPRLVRALSNPAIRWVIPEFLLPLLAGAESLPRGEVIVPREGETIEIAGVRIRPFLGEHWQAPRRAHDTAIHPGGHGKPAMAYLLEQGAKRWLFPGDTRNYASGLLPDFGPLDVFFVHLWLGRGGALDDTPPLLEDFCRFCLSAQAQRVIVTHLDELGREADELWDESHFARVARRLSALAPRLPVSALFMGESATL